MRTRRWPWLCSIPLYVLLGHAACSETGNPDSPSSGGRAATRELLGDVPADFTAFLNWAQEQLETQPQGMAIPAPRATPPVRWPMLRLDDPELLAGSRKSCGWETAAAATAPGTQIGPFRSDRPEPGFSPQPVPKELSVGKDSLALMMGGFRIQCEDVGSIELTLSVPYGKHVSLAWSQLGSVVIPVESHDEPFTVRVLTDGFVGWQGERGNIAVITDGLGEGVITIHSLRFLPRASSYREPIGIQRVRLGQEIRTALYAHCPAEITYEGVELPKDATLRVGLGQVGATDSEEALAANLRTRFEVIVGQRDTHTVAVDREITTSGGWQEVAAPLAQWAGQRVDLTLRATSTATEAVAFWGNPVIYEPVDDPPLLVIYLIDTVASEHVGLYGYERETMPRLAALAERGVWFSQMFSNSARTIESIPDLMLSMPVERHGVYHNSTRVPEGLVTLAETLRGAGFATASFCTNVNAGPRQGMDQGFDTFLDRISPKPEEADRTIPLDEVMTWIGYHRDRPMFLYIHTAEPHSPYTAPEGFRDRFDPDYQGRFTGADFHDAHDPRDLAHLKALYDEEIVYADARLGMFFDALEEQGLLEKAHFFVTSDHGEEFFQHYQWEHGRDLHNEQTRIPLVAFGPTFAARGRIDVPAQLLDVMPTILEMFDLPAPHPLDGRSLLPLLRTAGGAGGAQDPLQDRNIYASNHNFRIEFGQIEYSVTKNGRWKLVFGATALPMYRGGPKSRFTLFDIKADPRERKNLIHARPRIARRLAQELVRWRLAQSPYDPGLRAPTVIDAEQMRELEALGYVGEKASSGDDAQRSRQDSDKHPDD